MKIYKLLSGLYYIGLVLIFAGLIMLLTNTPGAFRIYTAGVLPVLGIRIFNLVVSTPDTRRIYAILVISALYLTAVSAAIWFTRSYWIIFIAVAATLDGYASFRKLK
jgi:general stress protein CsbA